MANFRINEIIKFETDDGVEHTTLQAAQAHNDRRELESAIGSEFGNPIHATQARDVATWLIEHYIMTPKE